MGGTRKTELMRKDNTKNRWIDVCGSMETNQGFIIGEGCQKGMSIGFLETHYRKKMFFPWFFYVPLS
jgi:hypothetical protein